MCKLMLKTKAAWRGGVRVNRNQLSKRGYNNHFDLSTPKGKFFSQARKTPRRPANRIERKAS